MSLFSHGDLSKDRDTTILQQPPCMWHSGPLCKDFLLKPLQQPEGSTHSIEYETEAKSQRTPQLLPLGQLAERRTGIRSHRLSSKVDSVGPECSGKRGRVAEVCSPGARSLRVPLNPNAQTQKAFFLLPSPCEKSLVESAPPTSPRGCRWG